MHIFGLWRKCRANQHRHLYWGPNNHHLFYVGGSDMFDSFMLLSDHTHADYEKNNSLQSGVLTLLIENSRSLPNWGELGLYAVMSHLRHTQPSAKLPQQKKIQPRILYMSLLPVYISISCCLPHSSSRQPSLRKWKMLAEHKDRQQQTQHSCFAVVFVQNSYCGTHPPPAAKISITKDATKLHHHSR